jgi:hypothetical protein
MQQHLQDAVVVLYWVSSSDLATHYVITTTIYELLLLRLRLAVRERLGHPPVGPSFHCQILLDMSPSSTPGKSVTACIQFLHH